MPPSLSCRAAQRTLTPESLSCTLGNPRPARLGSPYSVKPSLGGEIFNLQEGFSVLPSPPLPSLCSFPRLWRTPVNQRGQKRLCPLQSPGASPLGSAHNPSVLIWGESLMKTWYIGDKKIDRKSQSNHTSLKAMTEAFTE